MQRPNSSAFAQRDTIRGFRRPEIGTQEATCIIYTQAAIYGLDDEGICLYVTGETGPAKGNASRCCGAQYVACFVAMSADGLKAQPEVGAQALFVGRGRGRRMALLRTPPITRVQLRDASAVTSSAVTSSAVTSSAVTSSAVTSSAVTSVESAGDAWAVGSGPGELGIDPRATALGLPAPKLLG